MLSAKYWYPETILTSSPKTKATRERLDLPLFGRVDQAETHRENTDTD